MKIENSDIIEEFTLILKYMDRLRESFRLEKEDVLVNPSIEALEKLRDRSRSLYLLRLTDHLRGVRKLKSRISVDLPGMEKAEELSKRCDEEANRLRAHLISTPNRLMRIFKAGGFRQRTDRI
jgi:hypothetical protein